MAMALRILLLVPLPGITATDPCVLHGEANRDPHLHFAHGGRADFRAQVIHDGDELLPLLEFTAANGASLQSEVEVGVSHCP